MPSFVSFRGLASAVIVSQRLTSKRVKHVPFRQAVNNIINIQRFSEATGGARETARAESTSKEVPNSLLIACYSVFASMYMLVSLVAPFFPAQANNWGISPGMVRSDPAFACENWHDPLPQPVHDTSGTRAIDMILTFHVIRVLMARRWA